VQQLPAADPADAEILKAAAALGVLGQGGSSAQRILAALYDPDVTPTRIAAVVGLEPGLTVRVLRVANSSLYGLRQKVATIDRAVLVLGLDAVRSVAAAACFDRSLFRNSRSLPVDVDALHRHSIAAAVAAEDIAKIRHANKAAEAFIAGLLHDLGVVIRLRLETGGVHEFVAALGHATPQATNDADSQAPRVGHEHCSSVTLEAWGLPASLVEATHHHHDPATAPEPHRQLAAITHISDYLSGSCGFNFECGGTTGELDRAALELLGLTAEDLAAVTAELPRRVAEMQRALAE
jgi:HD-like signal output (HDOD) protein